MYVQARSGFGTWTCVLPCWSRLGSWINEKVDGTMLEPLAEIVARQGIPGWVEFESFNLRACEGLRPRIRR